MKCTRRQFVKISTAVSAALASISIADISAFSKELSGLVKDAVVSGDDFGKAGAEKKITVGTCLQCGNTDGLLGFVDNNGILTKLEGNPKHPNTRGRLCAKGQAGIQQVYDPFRIKQPMLRIGNRGDADAAWKPISWEEAVTEVANRLIKIRKKDPGRFVYHQGRNRFKPFTSRFTNAFGTKHYFTHTSICESSLKTGYKNTFGADIDTSDWAHSKYIISFGENIYEAAYMHMSGTQRVIEGRVDNNAKFVVFDPRLSNTAGRADEWFPLIPGTDSAILLAMSNVIMQEDLADLDFLNRWTNYPPDKLKKHLEKFTPQWAEKISSIPADDIRRIAIEFAKAKPRCFVRAYNGLSNNRNGAYNARNVAILNAIVGNIDKEGGFCLPKSTGFGKVSPEPDIDMVLEEIGMKDAEFPIEEFFDENYPIAYEGPHHLMPSVLKELDYKVDLYMLQQYNPLYSNPDEELWTEVFTDKNRIEFIVDFTPFWSETAKLASDLIIPDVTYMERLNFNDMPSVENIPFIQLYQPLIKPLYESRSMYDTLLAIAKKIPGMDKYFEFESIDEYCRIAVDDKWNDGAYERLKKDGVLIGKKYEADTYKSFDQLSENEIAEMRQFEIYDKKLSPEDIDKLISDGSTIPSPPASKEEAGKDYLMLGNPIKDKAGKKTLGLVRPDGIYKGFPTSSGVFEIYSPDLKKNGFEPLPHFELVPAIKKININKIDENLILITGKWNVHTQSRTANCWWLMEIVNYNPAWINTKTAKKLNIKTGDNIIINVPQSNKTIKCKVNVTEGINPKCIFVSFSLGHWEYGPLASKGKFPPDINKPDIMKELWPYPKKWPGEPFEAGYARPTTTELGKPYPAKDIYATSPAIANPVVKDHKKRTTVGWAPNSLYPADETLTDPIGAECAWSNLYVKVEKA